MRLGGWTLGRSRRTARAAGADFEMCVADTMAYLLRDEYVSRAFTKGKNDTGDIDGVRHNGKPVVVECKNEASVSLGSWWGEAVREAGNAGTVLCVVAHKRKGVRWDNVGGKKIGVYHWVTAPLSMMVDGFGVDVGEVVRVKPERGQGVLDAVARCVDGGARFVCHTRNRFKDDPWVTMTVNEFCHVLCHDVTSYDAAVFLIGDEVLWTGNDEQWAFIVEKMSQLKNEGK